MRVGLKQVLQSRSGWCKVFGVGEVVSRGSRKATRLVQIYCVRFNFVGLAAFGLATTSNGAGGGLTTARSLPLQRSRALIAVCRDRAARLVFSVSQESGQVGRNVSPINGPLLARPSSGIRQVPATDAQVR